MSVVLGALGEGIAAALSGLLALMLSVDLVNVRLHDVLTTVALGCAAALTVGLAYRRTDARVQLAVHLSATLCLAAGVYAVLLERGDVDLAIGVFLYCLLAPLVLCAVAVVVAGAVVLRSRRGDRWRSVMGPVLIAVFAGGIPFLGAVSGDPGDEPESAIRRQLGSDAKVTCSAWDDVEPGAVLCAVDAGTTWGAEDCVVRLGHGGAIVDAESLWREPDDASDPCRSLVG